jgi:hypothetical protein
MVMGRKERYRLEFHWASEKLITQLVGTMGRTLKKLSNFQTSVDPEREDLNAPVEHTCDLERIMYLKKHIGLEVHC